MRDTADVVERLGVERSWHAAEQASIVLHVIDATLGITDDDRGIRERLGQRDVIEVFNKVDLVDGPVHSDSVNAEHRIYVSAKTGSGLPELKTRLLKTAGWQPSGEGLFAARARHIQALMSAQRHLSAARQHRTELELLAEELRLAQHSLSEITGEFTADDLLGEIFSRFCIGK
jgi:tRNA modification GTPase